MTYRDQIEAYIEAHKKEMVQDIFTLCRIDSEKMEASEGKPYGDGPAAALAAALKMAQGYGFAVRNYDNYVGTVDLNDQEKQLDILAHLDVVPAGEGWQITEPFEPVEKDGILYGRGVADDKGPAVAALYALRCVKELGLPVKKNVRLILGCDEECGSSDIAQYYKEEKEAPMTFSPDADFPLTNVEKGRLPGEFHADFEPSELLPRLVSLDAGIKVNVVPGKAHAVVEGLDLSVMKETAEKVTEETGIDFELEADGVIVKILAVGEGAHAAHPSTGRNALTGLLTYLTRLPLAACPQMKLLADLLALMPHGDTSGKAMGIAMSDEISGDLTLAFSMLKVTDRCLEGVFDSRCPVCATEDNVLKAVKEKMAACGITLTNDSMTAPHHVDENSRFVKTLLQVYEEYTGLEGRCQSTGGGTYVHDLKNGVAFGAAMPGTDTRMHGADERAVLGDLVVSAKIFAQAIVELCKNSETR